MNGIKKGKKLLTVFVVFFMMVICMSNSTIQKVKAEEPTTYTISGRALDVNLNDMEGPIDFSLTDKNQKTIQTYTNETGNSFSFQVPAGDYRVIAKNRKNYYYGIAYFNDLNKDKVVHAICKNLNHVSLLVLLQNPQRYNNVNTLNVKATFKGETLLTFSNATESEKIYLNYEFFDSNFDRKQDAPIIIDATLDGYRPYHYENFIDDIHFKDNHPLNIEAYIWFFKNPTFLGNVQDEDGKIMENASVTVKDSNGKIVDSTKTDANGNYSLTNGDFKTKNTYQIYVSKKGFTDSDIITIKVSNLEEYKNDFVLHKKMEQKPVKPSEPEKDQDKGDSNNKNQIEDKKNDQHQDKDTNKKEDSKIEVDESKKEESDKEISIDEDKTTSDKEIINKKPYKDTKDESNNSNIYIYLLLFLIILAIIMYMVKKIRDKKNSETK